MTNFGLMLAVSIIAAQAIVAQIEPSYAFAALMFAVSCGTLIFSVIQNKNKVSNEYVDDLEKRIVHLEQELQKCEEALIKSNEKNFELMKEILAIRGRAVRKNRARAKIKKDNANH